MFTSIEWRADRAVLHDLTFRLEHVRSDAWDGGDQHFRFYKVKHLVDQYAAFFKRHPDFTPQHVFELGIYHGGSVAFWHELLAPSRLVAIDILDREDSAYFTQWVQSRSLQGRVKTQWRTDQTDKAELRRLVNRELAGRLDLVIDDASHLYSQTKTTFETLFPYCKPGSFYIIEDWAWDHWAGFGDPAHAWAGEQRLTQLVIELVEAAGTSADVISSVEVFQGFVAVQRGPQELDPGTAFSLDKLILRRPATNGALARTGQTPTQRLKTMARPVVRTLRGLARNFRRRSS